MVNNTRTSNFGTPLLVTLLMISKSYIKLVQSLKLKKYRQKYKLFLVEGTKQLNTILDSNRSCVKSVIAVSDWFDEHAHLFWDIEQHLADEKIMKELSAFTTVSPVMAVCEFNDEDTSEIKTSRKIVYLDDVQDPGNVGTIIRLCDWYGVELVLRGSGSADFYNPKTVQSTMGSITAVKLVTLKDVQRIDQLITVPLVVSSLYGTNLKSNDLPRDFCLVIGNESKGVRKPLIDASDYNVLIPSSPDTKADSLNAAVSTGILLDRLFNI